MEHFFNTRTRIMKSMIAVMLFVVAQACSTAVSDTGGNSVVQQEPGLPVGKSLYTFTDWAGLDLPVWTYLPRKMDANTPIVFVMHGTKRQPERYRDQWISLAERYGLILVAPEFSREQYPGSRSYNLGGVFDKNGGVTPKDKWAYSAIEPIFDDVKRRLGSGQERYTIYGHSAGAQFVHRFMYFIPDARVSRAIAANAGWYTMPLFDIPWPYGLKGTPLTEQGIGEVLEQPMVVLLGTADDDPGHSSLRRTPEANAQGPHRYARGQVYYKVAQAQAERLKADLGWEMVKVPRVAHDNRGMAKAAARIVAQSKK